MFHTKLWYEWLDLNQRPLPPQLTWVCPLVRFACFHTVSAPGHLLLGDFLSTVSACSVFVCGKNCGQTAFWAYSGGDLSVEKRTEFFLQPSKICKWSGLWSTVLHCICRQPVSVLSVTQTVVKIHSPKKQFLRRSRQRKGIWNFGCDFESGLQSRAHIIGYNATKTKAMLPIFQLDLPPCSREILQGDTRSRHLLY